GVRAVRHLVRQGGRGGPPAPARPAAGALGAPPAARRAERRMSLRTFQSVLARLATEPAFRDRVRSGEEVQLAAGLTPLEEARLRAAAGDPGLHVTATLVGSFRLAKILQLLPLTRQMLGDARLVQEARAFWRESPPRTFY